MGVAEWRTRMVDSGVAWHSAAFVWLRLFCCWILAVYSNCRPILPVHRSAELAVQAAQNELAGAEAGDGRDASNRSLQERLADAQNAQVCGGCSWGCCACCWALDVLDTSAVAALPTR